MLKIVQSSTTETINRWIRWNITVETAITQKEF